MMKSIPLPRLYQQAVYLLQQQRHAEAQKVLKQCLRLASKDPALWHMMAACQRKLGQLRDSEKSFQKALKLAPAQAEILNGYANLLAQTEREQQAEQLYRKAISSNPSLTDSYINLGRLYADSGRHKAALEIYHQGLSRRIHPALLQGAGYSALQLKQYDEAKQYFRQLLQHQPDNLKATLGLATTLYESGEQSAAFELLAPLAQRNEPQAIRQLARYHQLQGNSQQALELYRHYLELQPGDPEVLDTLSKLLWLAGDDKWTDDYLQAIAKLPGRADLRLSLAHKLALAGLPDKAMEQLDAVLQQQPNHIEALLYKGRLCRDSGQFEQALALHKKAVKLAPDSTAALNELGYSHIALGQGAPALAIYRQLIARQPENQGWWCLQSTALRLLNDDKNYARFYDINRFIQYPAIEVPEGYDNLAQFNQALRDYLITLHTGKRHPIDQTLRGGTQTLEDLFDDPAPVIQLLKQQITKAVHHYIDNLRDSSNHPLLGRLSHNFRYIGSWSVRLTRQGFHKNHFHGEGWISGCYYVVVPNAVTSDGQGWIQFGQPEIPSRTPIEPDFAIRPEPGRVALFPSYMWHGTRPFHTDEERITVPFDIVPVR